MHKRISIMLSAALVFCWATSQALSAANDSSKEVKATATAGKIDGDGNQEVVITVTINKPFHIYANPVGADILKGAQTKVTFTTKVEKSNVSYPAGHLVKDASLGENYFTYEGKVVFKAKVKRAKGDTSPLDLLVHVQACDADKCLLPAKIKVTAK